MSAKEKCFKDALKSYERHTGENLGVETEQPWRLLDNGTWERASNWWSALNSFRSGYAAQIRRPDLTINGKKVFDLKFTRADGTVDDWGTRPGAGNNRTQREDYNDINRQNSPDMDNEDPKLDPETCNCGNRGAAPVAVPVPNYGLFFVPSPAPGFRAPMPGGVPGLPPIRVPMPLPVPIPSSRDYKQDIAPTDLQAERLLDLEVKRFAWRDDGSADLGLIAEEVRAVVPELYHEQPGFVGIQAGQLPYYLLQLVQRQQAMIDKMAARIAALEGQSQDEATP